jgi:hypothetical protein
MSDNKIIKAIKTALGMSVELEQMKLADGQTVLEADTFEKDSEIFVVTAEGNVPVPVGEYELEDGRILVIAEEGIVGEIKEKEEAEGVEDEAPKPASATEEMGDKIKVKKTIESMVKETIFSKMELLENENKELKLQLEVALSKEKEYTLSMSEPLSNPISFNPENTSSTQHISMSPNKGKTTMDSILSKINKL